MRALDVISRVERWSVEKADALEWLRSLPNDCCDLVFTSPPYEKARLYLENGEDLNIARDTEEWVAWLIEIIRECSRVCTGLVAFVVEGQQKDFRYSCGPMLLMADLHRAGFNLRKPPLYVRHGIPGSGEPDWLKNRYEFCVCVSRPGQLPWSDNTACGHPPTHKRGGKTSHRGVNGNRANAFGVDTTRPIGTRPIGDKGKGSNGKGETYRAKSEPAEAEETMFDPQERKAETFNIQTRRGASGERYTPTDTDKGRPLPVLANPGNLIDCGSNTHFGLGNENEAPFPEELAAFFVKSFCPPDGIALDCFGGSGTTMAVAVAEGRRAISCDLRQSQVDLAKRRIAGVTPTLFPA